MSPASEAPNQVSSPTVLPAAPCKPTAQPSLDPIKPQIEEGLQELPISSPAVVLDHSQAFQRAPAVPQTSRPSGRQSTTSSETRNASHNLPQGRRAEDAASRHAVNKHKPDAASEKATSMTQVLHAESSTKKHASNELKPVASSSTKVAPTGHTAHAEDIINRHASNAQKLDAPAQNAAGPGTVPATMQAESVNGSTRPQQALSNTTAKQTASPEKKAGFAATASAWLNRHTPSKKNGEASDSKDAQATTAARKSTKLEQDAGKAEAPSSGVPAPAAQMAGSRNQTPVFQASGAAATTKKLDGGAQPVAAALEPSKVSAVPGCIVRYISGKLQGGLHLRDVSIVCLKLFETCRVFIPHVMYRCQVGVICGVWQWHWPRCHNLDLCPSPWVATILFLCLISMKASTPRVLFGMMVQPQILHQGHCFKRPFLKCWQRLVQHLQRQCSSLFRRACRSSTAD